jgi:hypothetical protein
MRNFVALSAILLIGALLCSAQSVDSEKAAAINKVAEQFTTRLHQTLDVGAQVDLFAPDVASLYREYPGDFLPFSTPRLAKPVLRSSDDASLRRKLFADWNLTYLTSVFVRTAGPKPDPLKALPPEFAKAAKKSVFLKPFVGLGTEPTLLTADELNQYLAEAEQMIPVLRRSIKPEMVAGAFQNVQATQPGISANSMGFDTTYTIRRDSLLLVMAERQGELKLITLAAPEAY